MWPAVGVSSVRAAALCYAEFASTVPVAGSPTRSPTPLRASWSPGGRLRLVLESRWAAGVVAKGWSATRAFLGLIGPHRRASPSRCRPVQLRLGALLIIAALTWATHAG